MMDIESYKDYKFNDTNSTLDSYDLDKYFNKDYPVVLIRQFWWSNRFFNLLKTALRQKGDKYKQYVTHNIEYKYPLHTYDYYNGEMAYDINGNILYDCQDGRDCKHCNDFITKYNNGLYAKYSECTPIKIITGITIHPKDSIIHMT